MNQTHSQHLGVPATVDLTGSDTIADMAAREAWSPDLYAVVLAENIRETTVPLDTQRERLAALAQVGAVLRGDAPAAEELARHALILGALFERFALVSAGLSTEGGGARQSVASERYLNAALKAQRACMATLSTLKVLRDSAAAPTTPAPGAGSVSHISPLKLDGSGA